jgi:two-component system OmpR family response regulator
MLRDIEGMEVLRRIREHLLHVPVLFLTARDAVEDRVAGLPTRAESFVLTVGDLTLDEDSHEVSWAGREIALTATEFELLRS